tara:strand:- start:255 stop:665 length:411 start_codon:yes stop_codon:yes gene_type:complete
MATVALTFSKLNASLQVGDTAYYVTTGTIGGYYDHNDAANTPTSFRSSDSGSGQNSLVKIGEVKEINKATNVVTCTTTLTTGQLPNTSTHFIFFTKDNEVNLSTLLGYYMEIKLKNTSTTEAELFSVGCDFFESSK